MTLPFLVPLIVVACVTVAAGQTATPTATSAPSATPTAVPTLDLQTCFAVPDSSDSLVAINAATGAESIVGPTGAGSTIRGLAIGPYGTALYAATAA